MRLVPRARRLRHTPQLRAAKGEKRSFEGNPGRCGLRARGPGSSFPFLYPGPRRSRRSAHLRPPRRKKGLVGETWFPPRVTERAGFEPATHLSARTRFPVALLRPLGHLSVLRSGEGGIRTLDGGIHPHNALAGRRLQPLGHFSAGPRRIADCLPQDGCAGKARPSSTRRRQVGASEGAAFSHSATSPRVRAG